MKSNFSISGQHYLFNVQAFAHVILMHDVDSGHYRYTDNTTLGVIEDVANGKSDIGIIMHTDTRKQAILDKLDQSGLDFVELIASKPRIAISASHPMANSKCISLHEMKDYPYIYFEQEPEQKPEQEPSSDSLFAEEAICGCDSKIKIACSDRASLSELLVAINGYTITSGILVGVSDGAILSTVALDTNEILHLGYITKKGEVLKGCAKDFVDVLREKLPNYAKF